eukprot:m.166246 g.166246  ORF g.166246 m.166246 type:complete len:50 (+) comp31420_c7_seq2:416-565(+)
MVTCGLSGVCLDFKAVVSDLDFDDEDVDFETPSGGTVLLGGRDDIFPSQ